MIKVTMQGHAQYGLLSNKYCLLNRPKGHQTLFPSLPICEVEKCRPSSVSPKRRYGRDKVISKLVRTLVRMLRNVRTKFKGTKKIYQLTDAGHRAQCGELCAVMTAPVDTGKVHTAVPCWRGERVRALGLRGNIGTVTCNYWTVDWFGQLNLSLNCRSAELIVA